MEWSIEGTPLCRDSLLSGCRQGVIMPLDEGEHVQHLEFVLSPYRGGRSRRSHPADSPYMQVIAFASLKLVLLRSLPPPPRWSVQTSSVQAHIHPLTPLCLDRGHRVCMETVKECCTDCLQCLGFRIHVSWDDANIDCGNKIAMTISAWVVQFVVRRTRL